MSILSSTYRYYLINRDNEDEMTKTRQSRRNIPISQAGIYDKVWHNLFYRGIKDSEIVLTRKVKSRAIINIIQSVLDV